MLPFSAWQGRPVLVNLWASWCPACIEELPALQALEASWVPRGLVLVGVAVGDPAEHVAAAVRDRGLSWPQALDDSERARRTFDTDELPTSLLYAPDGTLLLKQVGALRVDDPAVQAALLRAVSAAP